MRVDFDFHESGPGGSISPGYDDLDGTGFSVRWSGEVVPANSETYTFTTNTDDGVRLWIEPWSTGNRTQLIDDWNDHAPEENSGSFDMTAGETYNITMEYYQRWGGATAQLYWESPSVDREIIEPVANLGINTSAPNDYLGNHPFADAIDSSRNWKTIQDNNPASTDSDGWPTQDAQIEVWSGGKDHHTNDLHGDYDLTFTGEADVSVPNWTGGEISDISYDSGTNTTTATVTQTDSDSSFMAIVFENTSRNDGSGQAGVKDVSLMRPKTPGGSDTHAEGTVVNEPLKALFSNYTHIRMMNFLETNGNPLESWSDRTPPDYASQNVREIDDESVGASYEHAVMLCNETGKDLWVHTPYQATDTFIKKVAQLIRYGSDGEQPYTSPQSNPEYPPLNSNLKVYVEYSNEVWNKASGFPQYWQNFYAARDAVRNDTELGRLINYDDVAGDYYENDQGTMQYEGQQTLNWRLLMYRTKVTSDIFRDVWGDSAMHDTVRPLYEWQYSNARQTASAGLRFLENYFNDSAHVSDPQPPDYYLWGAGGAWYNTTAKDGYDDNADTVDEFYNSGVNSLSYLRNQVSWARTYGLKHVSYEGGFKIGKDQESSQLYIDANTDSRAKSATKYSVEKFFERGGDMASVYMSAGDVTYGVAFPNVHHQDTPKATAYREKTDGLAPEPTHGTSVPATIDAVDYNIRPISGYDPGDNLELNSGEFVSYTLNVDSPGEYEVGTDKDGSSNLELFVDGEPVGSGPATVSLSAGVHALRVKNVGSSQINDMDSVRVQSGAGGDLVATEANLFNGGSSGGSGAASDSTWSSINDGKATGDVAMKATPNDGVNVGDSTDGPELKYVFEFPSSGTYYVWVRTRGASNSDDSCHVGLNGTPATYGGYGLGDKSGSWAWKNTVGGSRVTVDVPSAGTHTVNLWMREDGTEVDKIVLSTDSSYTPSGTGPDEQHKDSGGG